MASKLFPLIKFISKCKLEVDRPGGKNLTCSGFLVLLMLLSFSTYLLFFNPSKFKIIQ